MPDVSRSRHMQSGIMIKTIFIPLLVLASCLYSCLSLLLLSNCTDQTFIRSITDDQTRTQRIPLGSANSFKSTRSYSLEIMIYCVKPIGQFWFHPPFILQANRKCPSPMIICLNMFQPTKKTLTKPGNLSPLQLSWKQLIIIINFPTQGHLKIHLQTFEMSAELLRSFLSFSSIQYVLTSPFPQWHRSVGKRTETTTEA